MFDVNLAHSFVKHHDVISTDLKSSHSSRHELFPYAHHETPSVAS